MTTPITVLTPQDHDHPTWVNRRLTWCRANGIDPNDAVKIEIYREGRALFAQVTAFQRDEQGVCEMNGEDPATRTYRVQVDSLPPGRG